MTTTVLDADRYGLTGDDIARFADAILTAEGVDEEAVLTVRFVDDAQIADLNERYMGKAEPTDVLSFPIEDAQPGMPPQLNPGGPPLELGDIFIATNVVRQHATEFGVGFDEELCLMVCHGVLHILGWDHMTDAEAEAMEAREAEHLASLGMARR